MKKVIAITYEPTLQDGLISYIQVCDDKHTISSPNLSTAKDFTNETEESISQVITSIKESWPKATVQLIEK